MPCDGVFYINIPLKSFRQYYFSPASKDRLEGILIYKAMCLQSSEELMKNKEADVKGT